MTSITVGDVMTREVVAVSPDTGIESAARLMTSRHISGLPVVENERLVGVISLVDLVDPDQSKDRAPDDSDRTRAAFYTLADGTFIPIADLSGPNDVVVRDVMTPYVISVEESATIVEAARQMTEYEVHRLLVMTGETLTGIVSSLDLLRGFLKK